MKKKNSAGNTVVTLVALCSDDCCCPTIEFTSEKVTIKDDYGGVVFLTIPEWEMLQNIDYSTIINAVYNR